ncbi:MAG TPA: glycoside hydrolase family 27 protein [Pseudolysinimonas sp.]|nr:glycoside hydrolase family 27 protein [Pseudolysinimonas sp.]
MSVRTTTPRRLVLAAASAAVLIVALSVALSVALLGLRPASPRAIPPATALGRTPPMGWSSWNHFGCAVDAELVERTADALAASGLQKLGYRSVDIDDCWMTHQRDPHTGELVPDPVKFPQGIAAVARSLHARGFSLGIYEDAGTETCAGFPGSLGHEQVDAQTFARWGVDTLKYDNCNHAGRSSTRQYIARFTAMHDALLATGRPIFLAICEWGVHRPWTWAHGIGQSWRTTHDIADSYASMLEIFRQNVGLSQFAGPGGWNDPDMLEVGNGGMTPTEERTEFTLWAAMAAPLISGADIRSLDPDDLAIYSNREVIAIDQDPRGGQASLIAQNGEPAGSGGIWVLSKPLADGGRAVVLFNSTDSPRTISTTASAVGLRGSGFDIRDVWSGSRSTTSGGISALVAPHAAAFFRIAPDRSSRTVSVGR